METVVWTCQQWTLWCIISCHIPLNFMFTEVVELLERQPEVIHLTMAFPTFGVASHLQTIAEGAVFVVRHLRDDADGQVGHGAAEQAFANPTAAADRVVVEVGGMCD